ncbi:MAG: hypothetical protein V3T73_01735, partial [Dehalococcoidales bacterium]
ETEKVGQHLSELWGGAGKQSLLEFFIALAKDGSSALSTPSPPSGIFTIISLKCLARLPRNGEKLEYRKFKGFSHK